MPHSSTRRSLHTLSGMMERIESLTLNRALDAVASRTPTPGGGAVASVVGALGAALAQMVVNYSVGKKKFAEHEPALQSSLEQLERARTAMLELAAEDAAAYAVVNELMKLPEADERRRQEYAGAIEMATQAPLATCAGAVALLRHFETLAPMTNQFLKSDLAIAAILAEACAAASAQNVRINLPSLRDAAGPERASDVENQLEQLLADAGSLRNRVLEMTG